MNKLKLEVFTFGGNKIVWDNKYVNAKHQYVRSEKSYKYSISDAIEN